MATIGLKIRDTTYDRLKWLKTRFEFVHENSMSWDEFFERVSRDVLLILAHDLKVKNRGNITAEGILSIISGEKSQADPDLVESLKSLDTAFGKNTGISPSD